MFKSQAEADIVQPMWQTMAGEFIDLEVRRKSIGRRTRGSEGRETNGLSDIPFNFLWVFARATQVSIPGKTRSLAQRPLQVLVKPFHHPSDCINAIFTLLEAVAFIRIVMSVHDFSVFLE
jgi:hypothetical protein